MKWATHDSSMGFSPLGLWKKHASKELNRSGSFQKVSHKEMINQEDDCEVQEVVYLGSAKQNSY